ncbi:MAG: hypothetical protein ACOWWO_19070 [Peptococcaceae bacterium]
MKNYVEGQLAGNGALINTMKSQLEKMGFEVTGEKFRKYGQVEAVVNELVPLIERQGVNVFDQLYLNEYDGQGMILGKYEKGKVTRYRT